MHTAKKVLVIVPAFNEERSIQYVVKRVKSLYPDFKVLVINDGSTDRTAEEAVKAGASVITLPYNLGIGGTVQTGFKVAEKEGYDIAVQIDGDAQHDPAYLKNILAPVISGQFDMCIGSRFLSETSAFKSTFVRRIGITIFSNLLRLLTRLKLTDPTSGFRAFNKKLIQVFAANYPVDFPEPEVIQVARRHGAKIGEVPVNMQKRLGGKSSINYFSALYYMTKVTLAILIDTLRRKKTGE